MPRQPGPTHSRTCQPRPLPLQAISVFPHGPKDGHFEPALYRQLQALRRRTPAWVVWDDILDRHMLQFWRDIALPKRDLTSFGHWTGTGLMLWPAAP